MDSLSRMMNCPTWALQFTLSKEENCPNFILVGHSHLANITICLWLIFNFFMFVSPAKFTWMQMIVIMDVSEWIQSIQKKNSFEREAVYSAYYSKWLPLTSCLPG